MLIQQTTETIIFLNLIFALFSILQRTYHILRFMTGNMSTYWFFFYSVSDTILSVRAFVKSRAVCLEELQPLFTEVKNSLMTGSQPRSGLIVQKTENEVRNVTSIISYTRHLLYMVTSAGAVLLY